MFRIMRFSIFKLALLFFVCPITLQHTLLTLPPKAVNAERIKLLKNALSWMTFKKNGQLANDQDLVEIFGALKDRYLTSKYYKTLIIAFARGVLPKLTLKENARCAPAYTLEYKDSHNNSATYLRLKEFIIDSYDKRGDTSRQFCDYREGLVCSQKTSKCECPPGSKMESIISQGSTEKRCLVQENEVCNLIDLDHDPSSKYEAVKKHIPETILNMEKPVSCKMGTQCRFKSNDQITPRCYPVNDGPWDRGRWDIDFGENCTLGLYGDTGQCKVTPGYDPDKLNVVFDGYTCFNFGPRSKPKSPRVGICAHDVGSYGISQFKHNSFFDVQMIGFVSPTTTPLRGKRLYDYYFNYTKKLGDALTIASGLQENVTGIVKSAGSRCNVENSEKMFELWKWFKSLEDTPPPEKDYLATEAELDDKFKEAEALTVDLKKKMCQYRSDYPTSHALRCVRNSTDAAGNDGRCEVIPEGEDVTLEWAKLFYEYRQHVERIFNENSYWQEINYRKDIYEPELECDPKLGPPPGSANAAPSTDSDVLEGGYCPPDRGCYEDYGDYTGIYGKDCVLKDAKPRVWCNCQDLSDDCDFGWRTCETKHLDDLFGEELQTVSSSGGLQRGDACQYDVEVWLRDWIEHRARGLNKYKRLIELEKFKNGIGGTGLCDRTKLLECSQKSGTCECLANTQPREVELGADMKYYSDHCYVASGDCRPYALKSIFSKSSQVETNEINRHYKKNEDEGYQRHCQKANWCVFVLFSECTTEKTGSTGYEEEEPTTTSTTDGTTTDTDVEDESEFMCVGNKCGWEDAGQAKKEIDIIFKMLILTKVFNYYSIKHSL